MKAKKILAGLMAAALVTVPLAGCGSTQNSTATADRA